MAVTITQAEIDQFWKRGHLVVRSVFRPDEIARMRAHAATTELSGADLLGDPVFRELITDPRICSIAAAVLREIPVYFGDSVLSYGAKPGRWHKDNPDRYDGDSPDWKSNYPLLKMGVYFQDHSQHSGGISIRDFSHMSPGRKKGKPVYMDTQIGDVVVFHFRATHRGSTSLLKLTQTPLTSDTLDRHLVPDFLKIPRQKDRYAVLFTFGAAGPDLDRYIAYLATRQFSVKRASFANYDEKWLKTVDPARLTLRDTREEIQSMPATMVHRNHKTTNYD
jgi:hypothetical protein